jgi:Tfp pilus assembly protein PilV
VNAPRTARRWPGRLAHGQAGVSLIEALVALGVMAFGMLGLVGMQSSMRMYADVAKQRSEAVRIAQEQIEDWRSYSALAGGSSYATIATMAPTAPTAYTTTNASYLVSAQVPTPVTNPPLKTVVVDVTWTDRSGDTQGVRLSTRIAGIAPELAGALGAPANGDPVRRPLGRNRNIPLGALPMPDGRSGFLPPGAGPTVLWVFDNVTGVINLCTVSGTFDPNNPATYSCGSNLTTDYALPLSGYLRYDLGTASPNAQTPLDAPPAAYGLAALTGPTVSGATATCTMAGLTYSSYYCAVQVNINASGAVVAPWSGRPAFGGSSIATSTSDNSASHIRICRYFDLTGTGSTGGAYTHVAVGKTNQNFLAISAGSGAGDAYACPTGTALHQPV